MSESIEEFMARRLATEEEQAVVPPAPPPSPATQVDLRVHGRTYEVREKLKAIGCRWDGSAWVAPNPKVLEQARAVVQGQKLEAPPADLRAASTRDLVVELLGRADWEVAIGVNKMCSALRARGYRVSQEPGETVGELLSDAPTLEEFEEQLAQLMEYGQSSAEKVE